MFAFTGFGDVDLHMREPRYREVETGPPARFEAFYRNALAGSPPGAVAFFRDRIPGLDPAGMDRRSWSDHLDWLGRQGAEIPDAELRARLQGPDQQRTLAWLTAEKILVPDGRYPRET